MSSVLSVLWLCASLCNELLFMFVSAQQIHPLLRPIHPLLRPIHPSDSRLGVRAHPGAGRRLGGSLQRDQARGGDRPHRPLPATVLRGGGQQVDR
eukprot:841582-Prorocentrum_minimum.AAC.2